MPFLTGKKLIQQFKSTPVTAFYLVSITNLILGKGHNKTSENMKDGAQKLTKFHIIHQYEVVSSWG